MNVLVDSSVWIDYFRSAKNSMELDDLIDDNIIVINELILAELVPFLKLQNQVEVIELLYEIRPIPLNINWQEIISFQTKCLKTGINGIGIPDLIIAQNVLQYGCQIYSLDKHFRLLNQVLGIGLYL